MNGWRNLRVASLGALLLMLAVLSGPAFAQGQKPSPAGEVKAAEGSLAELPLWPVGFKVPKDLVERWAEPRSSAEMKKPDADVLVWTPPGAKGIRGILMFANNTDLVKIGEHKRVREIATKHDMAIIYWKRLSGQVIERVEPPALADVTMTTLLDIAAKQTGQDDIRHAPWVTMGKSSRGRLPFWMAWWFPDRVVATIAYHAEAPTWPMPEWSKVKDQSVLHVSVNGLSEWDGTWYRHVRPALLNYHRKTNWLAHQLVIYGVDHGYYPDYYLYPNFGANLEKNHRFTRCTDVWDYLARFIDKAMTLRVPAGEYPRGKAMKLLQVRRDTGYLIHPRAPEEMLGSKWFAFRQGADGAYQTIVWPDEPTPVFDKEQGVLDPAKLIQPAKDVPEAQRAGYMWVPDEEMARAWLGMHSLYKLGDRVMPK